MRNIEKIVDELRVPTEIKISDFRFTLDGNQVVWNEGWRPRTLQNLLSNLLAACHFANSSTVEYIDWGGNKRSFTGTEEAFQANNAFDDDLYINAIGDVVI